MGPLFSILQRYAIIQMYQIYIIMKQKNEARNTLQIVAQTEILRIQNRASFNSIRIPF
jgi:hypothetical protein